MNEDNIKKLARYTVRDNKFDKSVADFALKNLKRRELMVYLRYLKLHAKRNSVRVLSGTDISSATRNKLMKMFSAKNVYFETDGNIKNGLQVEINDTIIDLSMAGYLDETIANIENI